MWVSALALNDYRSYAEVVLEFSPGVIVFTGPNGAGKTNLVESLIYLSTLSSHRVNSDSALVHRPAPQKSTTSTIDTVDTRPKGAVVRAKIITGEDEESGRTRVLELEIVAGRANRARINRQAARPRELLGELALVSFAPEDLELVRGDPATRRKFLDELTTTLRPALAGVRADYDKTARQRAAFLKDAAARGGRDFDATQLDIWNDQIVPLGAQIIHARMELVNKLQPLINAAYRQVSAQDTDLSLEYLVSGAEGIPQPAPEIGEIQEFLRASLSAREREETRRGVNLVGPHRDELVIRLGNFPAKGFASHGETWSASLALKLGAFDLIDAELETRPVLVLDDAFAELDSSRREALLQVLERAEQVFITAAVKADLPAGIPATFYNVTPGKAELAGGE